jgi:hypothetical protein
MIGNTGYEVKQTLRLGGKEIVLAEDMEAEGGFCYLVCQYTENGIFEEYSKGVASDDYLEAMQTFVERLSAGLTELQASREALSLPASLYTAQDCYAHDWSESIEKKVVAIKAEVLSPEYRRGDVQLVYAVSGSGSRANPMGSAVYCYHLNDGAHTRFERRDVLGVVRELPAWARESLARIQADLEKPAEAKEYAGNYEVIERIEAGRKVFALGYCKSAVKPYGTWEGHKESRGSFYWGHYFDTHKEAAADLHERAGKEQRHLDAKKRSGEAR